MSINKAASLVLVSGATGYLGSHCVKVLLTQGYRVRGTVRSLKNAKKIDPIRELDTKNHLELVEADLMRAETWPGAVIGVDFVLHVASPFVLNADENTIKTAVEDGVDWTNKIFDETCWSNPDNSEDHYSRSKTFAERAAWDFHESLPKEKRFALTTINPTLIVGPLITNEEGTSAKIVKEMLEHKYPAVPELQIGVVDVRDVAFAHVHALEVPASDGQRVILSAKPLWYKELTQILGKELEPQGYCLCAMTAPRPMMWLASFFDPTAKISLPLLGKECRVNNNKSKALLDVKYHDVEKSVVEMAYSLIERGIAKKTKKYRGVPFDVKLE